MPPLNEFRFQADSAKLVMLVLSRKCIGNLKVGKYAWSGIEGVYVCGERWV